MTLTRIAHKQIYAERTEQKAWGRLNALAKAGYLARHELPENNAKYWTLGKAGVAYVGATRDWHKGLGSGQAFKRWLTTLLFCLDGKVIRERLDPFLMRNLPPGGFYQEPLFKSRDYFVIRDDEVDRIGCIRPAADGEPYRIARKCLKDLELHSAYPSFKELMRQGRFVLAMVVANRFQVQPIQAAIDKTFKPLENSEAIKPLYKVYLRDGLASLLPVGRKANS
jgi:hypothetical protein